MTLIKPNLFIYLSIGTAWFFDYLFWDESMGVSFLVYVLLILGVGLYLSNVQEVKPAKASLWLLLPILLFTSMSVVFVTPFVTFLNRVFSFVLLMVFVHTYQGGGWWKYGLKEYFMGLLSLIGSMFIRQTDLFSEQKKNEDAPQVNKIGGDRFWQIIRGLLLMLPIVGIFGGLLGEADPIFEGLMVDFWTFLKIDNIGEYIFRGIFILILGFLLTGIYLHGLYKNHDEKVMSGVLKALITPFLGIVEAAIVLVSVNVLFLVFVVVQFQYFFGGVDNISLSGYSYADYARRGFEEMVVVAFFSLVLFLALSAVTKRNKQIETRLFSGLGILLVLNVGVILVSAFRRLVLYENAYGLTQLRIYSHNFMIWLGVLLICVIVLEVIRQQRYFVFASLLVSIGFLVSLNFLNVDRFILIQNIERSKDDSSLDIAYLSSLSEDIVPLLLDRYKQADGNDALQYELAAVMGCHYYIHDAYEYTESWKGFNLSKEIARRESGQVLKIIERHNLLIEDDDGYSYLIINGEEIYCFDRWDW